ncbi:MAG TPA: hypothetical protein VLI54_04215 [Bacillota bacterium]|nr:hypothetical protein [Bacillota bacterium]
MPELQQIPGTYWAIPASPDYVRLDSRLHEERRQLWMGIGYLCGETVVLYASMPRGLDPADIQDRLEAVVEASGYERASLVTF